MSCRITLLAAVVSILCGSLVFFLFRFYAFPQSAAPGSGQVCAVLTLDESQDDRRIREILARGGVEGFISESSQEVPVDDFGALKMVPLDAFLDEVESFDPRDDGYAAKLRSFFVRGGKRFFFLLLDDPIGRKVTKLEKQLAVLLGDVPFTLTVVGKGRSVFRYFALLAAACALVLYFSHSRRLFAFELPVLLSFGWMGPSAFGLAALLCGIWELLRQPLRELSAVRHYERTLDYAGPGLEGIWEQLKPFRVNCLMVLFFLIFLVLFSIVGGFSPIPVFVGCGSFFLLYFLAFRAEAEQAKKSRHIPFTPVVLLPFKAKTFSLLPLLLPFGAVSMLALLFLFLPVFPPSPEIEPPVDARYLVSSGDYYRHVDFQKSFSYRPLHLELHPNAAGQAPGQGILNKEGYLRYYLNEDGLIGGGTSYAEGSRSEGRRLGDAGIGDPRFPLEKLMEFLLNYDRAQASNQQVAVGDFSLFMSKEWISVVMVLTACIMNLLPPVIQPCLRPLLRGKKNKKIPVFRDKRISVWKANRLKRSERRLPS